MKGIVETVIESGTNVSYGDLTELDITTMFDNWQPQPYPEYEFYTSTKAAWKFNHELKRWWRWENGCPTSMDIFIYNYDAKSRKRYKLKLKNKHPYVKNSNTTRIRKKSR